MRNLRPICEGFILLSASRSWGRSSGNKFATLNARCRVATTLDSEVDEDTCSKGLVLLFFRSQNLLISLEAAIRRKIATCLALWMRSNSKFIEDGERILTALISCCLCAKYPFLNSMFPDVSPLRI